VRSTDQFHIGVIVDDFDGTLAQLTELFGYDWCEPITAPTNVVFPDGEREVEFHMTYSKDAPRVEIVGAIAGTLWMPAEGSGIHHLGYWSDDIAADAAALEARGFASEAKGMAPDGTPMWAYNRNPEGPRIELVSSALKPMMEQWWSTGRMG
jgi:hypothetical protein